MGTRDWVGGPTGWRGKVVAITGASSGIGQGLALALAGRGAKLALAARTVESLETLATECRAAGGEAVAVPTDVTDPEACRRMVETTVSTFGGLDVLVNNAGLTMWARFDEITDLTLFERIMRVNYLGSVYATHHALPELKKRGGLVVAISSLTGKTGVPTRTGYAASKHAMQGFFDSLRIELADSGVAVLVVSPGFVATGIRERTLGPDGQPRGESPRDELRGTMPLDECVGIIVRAMEGRRREVVMTPRAKVGLWLKLVAPGMVDRMAARAVQERE